MYTNDNQKREELEEYIQKNRDYFGCVDVETYQAIRELLHSKKIMKDMSSLKKEEKIDMCRAMEEWYEDAVEKGLEAGMEAGRKAGLEAGRKAGMEAGMKAGMEAGRAEGRISIIIRMLSKGLGEEEIKGYTDGTDDEIAKAKLEMKAMESAGARG